MKSSRCTLASLAVVFLVPGSAVSQSTEMAAATEPTGGSAVPPGRDVCEQVYLVPFLKEGGRAAACVTDFWPHAMRDECMKEPGVPFEAELPLRLAVWRKGTVIWGVSSNGEKPEYFEAKLAKEEVSKLLARIDLKEFMTPENVQYSDDAISRYCPTTVIMVFKGERSLFLCSQLGAMERLQEYWFWEGSQERTFPFSKYSFDDFCKQIPESYSKHLKAFVRLRSQLKEVLPKNGRRITVGERVLWTVVAEHSEGSGVDSDEPTRLGDSRSTPGIGQIKHDAN